MSNTKKANILIVLPIRGNSKRLKNKNILLIRNKPMFLFVIDNIKKSKNNIRIVISTEDRTIKNLCKKNKIEFINRPKNLSLDNVEKQDVIVHVTKYLSNKENYYPKIVISLQVNTPQVNYRDLDKAIRFFKKIFIKKKIKEVFAIDQNNLQNGAFRIMTYKTVFQKTLSTKVGVFKTNYIDIHYYNDYLKVKRILEND
jgi:CMP-N-acetylneuraminic acid synthetase